MDAIMTAATWLPIKRRLKLWFLITLSCVALGPPFGAVWYCSMAALTQPSAFFFIILAVPFSYIYGGIPALLGGGIFALCVSAYGDRIKFIWSVRVLLGMLLGGLACVVCLPILGTVTDVASLTYIGCGVFAGALCAWRYRLRWIEGRLVESKT
jgi:hypothetical protein